jgi:cell fate regulator YaaT (PSP1 superfamily)
MKLLEVVRVRFTWPGKMYEFTNPHNLALKRGDKVIVEADRGGTLLGQVMIAPRIRIERKEDRDLTSVIRLASDQDLQISQVSDEFLRDVKNFFETRIRARNLSGVKLIDLEKADQGQRLIVYFNTEQRKFSPRDLAVEMGQKFKMRIDMRSVGVRDAARLSGGIGKCGLSLCCSTWIPDFQQISIRMAKDQGLSLDPDSINGQCGRLLCCLGYEHENYVQMGLDLPKIGKKVITPAGDARVVKLDILKGMITVRTEDGTYETFKGDEVKRKFGPQAGGPEENETV